MAQGHSHLIKIDLKGKSFEDLQKTGLAFDHGHYVKGESFIGDFSHEELEKLSVHGFQYEAHLISSFSPSPKILDCNKDTIITPTYFTPGNYAIGTMNGFLTLDEMYENLDLMAELYPELITKRAPIGNFTTDEGRPIYYLKISDNPNKKETEPQVLYTSLHHAREPASMSQMLFYMWYLLENYNLSEEIRNLVNGRELFFIPCVNPDGYKFNQVTNPSGFGYWRKNRALNEIDYGVDLNRNYGYKWGFNNIGSSDRGDSETFRGNEAFSETETKAVKELCRSNNFKIAINYHSFGNYLLIPWGFDDIKTSDQRQYELLAKDFTKYNNFKVGNVINTLNYQANGVSDDWMYGDTITKNKILAFTPEVGEEFWPERSKIGQINQSTQYMNLSAAWNAGAVVRMSEVSNKAIESNHGFLSVELTRTGLQNEAIEILCSTDHESKIQIINPQPLFLSPTESKVVKIEYWITNSIPIGEEVKFNIRLNTGEYSEKLVLTKKYLGSTFWKDQALSLSQWSSPNGNSLLLDNNDFTSEPSCFSDSPGSDIQKEELYVMVLNNSIDLRNAKYAYLSYNVKYDLNHETDFAQLFISLDGTQYHPVCGKYTVPGGIFQGLNQPVYTGTQIQWVNEWIDLKEFLGKEIYLQIKVGTSISQINHDGFSIDDLKIYSDLISQTNVPNAKNVTQITYDHAYRRIKVWNDREEIVDLSLFNSQGLKIPTSFNTVGSVHQSSVLDLPSGLYLLETVSKNNLKSISKLYID
ncbi:MAG: hypothetical protein HOP11_15820 [Saprospiraceae bacterium]|nr:hypothetical protein [Saprospiraceae bacterium]